MAAALTAAAFWLIPLVWQQIEPLDMGADYRVPYRLGNDYWNFERTCRQVCRGDRDDLDRRLSALGALRRQR